MHEPAPDLGLRPGLILEERYELKVEMARGAMGTVWLAERQGLGGTVAIKFTHLLDEGARERFFREAQVVAQLSSAHVVRVFEMGSYQTVPFLVMEHLKGETLRERLLAMGRLSAQEAVHIVAQVASAIEEAQAAGVIHRDLKPANIFLTGAASSPVVKVLDFGVARTQGSGMTGEGEVIGTPSYLSPEQARDSRKVDVRTDLWSLAVVAFECLTGDVPFKGSTGPQLIEAILDQEPPRPSHLADLPPAFDGWFWRATAKDPEARFSTVSEFVAELRLALDEGAVFDRKSHAETLSTGTLHQAMTTHRPEARPSKSARFAALLIAALGLAVFVVPFWGASGSGSSPPEKPPAPSTVREKAPISVESKELPPTEAGGPERPAANSEGEGTPSSEPAPERKAEKPSAPSVPKASSSIRPPQKRPVPHSSSVSRVPPVTEVVKEQAPEPPVPTPKGGGEEEDLWGQRL